MHKVVYNSCYGGFGLSEKAIAWLEERGGPIPSYGSTSHRTRSHPLLVECIETLGTEANGKYADLQIAILSGNQYIINEYDGIESVLEPQDIEWITIE